MEVTRRGARVAVVVMTVAVAVPVLAYLRDPPWLLASTSGFRGWQQEESGRRFRWMLGHASFFVPSSASTVELPVRAIFAPGDWPIAVDVSLDDRPADRVVLSDGAWHAIVLRLPAAAGRRVRRIDLRLDRMRDDDHGIMVGDAQIE